MIIIVMEMGYADIDSTLKNSSAVKSSGSLLTRYSIALSRFFSPLARAMRVVIMFTYTIAIQLTVMPRAATVVPPGL